MTTMRLMRCGVALCCAWITNAAATDWSADFEALLGGLARNYANFEYTLTEQRIDLPALAARHRQELGAATDDAQRRRAIERLLRAFRDPHLRIEWRPAPAGAAPACASSEASAGVAFDQLPAFEALPSAAARHYRAGILRGKPALGVIRIGLFVERDFASACTQAASRLQIDPAQPCDDTCGERLDRETARVLTESLASTVRELEAAGAERLVVDVTNNGGGSDWSEVVARALAGPLRSAPVSMLRHPAWVAHLRQLEGDMAALSKAATPADADRLRRATQRLHAAISDVATACDLSAAWTERALSLGERALPCSTLAGGHLFASGVEDCAPAGAQGPVDALLFRPAWYGVAVSGIAHRPLDVLVNGETHSSAEQFAALLRDNDRARVVGTATAGAACGHFTASGTGFTLPHSGAQVHVPDCVRWRRDGRSERHGIAPDLLVPWAPSDSAWQKAIKAAQTLRLPHAAATRQP